MHDSSNHAESGSRSHWPAGSSEMARLVRVHDWASTPLGPSARWSCALRTLVDATLCANWPMALYLGPDFVLLYNDAWAGLIGSKHPDALGRPACDVFPEIWPAIGPSLEYVLATGNTVEEKERLLPLRRDGSMRDYYFDFTFSPVLDETGRVFGIFNLAFETTDKVLAEAARRKSEQRLRLAQEAAGVGTFEWRIVDDVVIWSPEIERLYGLRESGFRGTYEAWARCVHPNDRAEAEKRAREALETGTLDAEWRIVRPDGEVVWVQGRGVVEKDAGGRPLRMIGANFDITAHKRAEAERERLLLQIEEQLRELQALYDNAPVGLGLYDRELRFRRVNPVLAEINGRSVAEHLGKVAWEVVPDLRAEAEPIFRQVFETGEPVTDRAFRGETPAAPGVERDWLAHFYPVKSGRGEVEGVGVVVEEVTAQKRAERQIAQERRFLDAVIENAPIGISIVSGAGGEDAILNETARRMTGVPAHGGLSGRYAGFRAFDADGRAYRTEDYPSFRALTKGEEINGEELIYEKDGERRRWLINSRPLRDDEGRIIAAVNAFWDVEDLRRATELRELLVAELNHRVKNTLAIVQALAQQTFKGTNNPHEAQKAFEGRLAALAAAHNLLTREHWEKADLGALAAAVLGAQVGERARFSLDGPQIVFPPKQAVTMAMVLHELTSNAVKYGALANESGTVTLEWRVSGTPEPRLQIIWRESGGPSVSPPECHGFGSRLIEHALTYDLTGKADLDFRPEGLVCTIEMPMPKDVQRPE